MKLLPCPFCGHEAEIERYGDIRQSTIYSCTCCGCRLETNETYDHGSQWNVRETYISDYMENYSKFLDEAHKRWNCITINADDARTIADWIEKKENLGIIVKCLRDLCSSVDNKGNNYET